MFWTSSPYAYEGPGSAWQLSFGSGYAAQSAISKAAKVRCVRSVLTRPGRPSDRYRVNTAEDTVTDSRTQLTWQRSVDAIEIGFDDATAYCSALGGGFRLPTLKELLTLVDPTRSAPAVDPVFPRTMNGWLLWASNSDPTVNKHTSVVFSFGQGVNEEYRVLAEQSPTLRGFLTYHVRCVR